MRAGQPLLCRGGSGPSPARTPLQTSRRRPQYCSDSTPIRGRLGRTETARNAGASAVVLEVAAGDNGSTGRDDGGREGERMDGERFDRFARALSTGLTRRGAVAAVGAAIGSLLVGRGAAPAGASPMIVRCGGITGLGCPPGYTCVDDPYDTCDPWFGGADCGGICQPEADYNPCAAILCAEGTTCCPNCGGVCVPEGTPCSEDLCWGEPCGSAYCGAGEYCCNPSCSICAPLGGGCTEQFCGGEPCGNTFCGAGEYCCNESCSICAPIGGACTAQICGGEPCGSVVCGAGEYCCNASCGICTPPDGVCIQIACI